MEQNYTIAKVVFSKETQGRQGLQYNVRFTTNETGEKSISGFFARPLTPGQTLTGKIVEKAGITREGQPVIYNNFYEARTSAPRPSAAPGISADQFQAIMRELRAINANILRVWDEVRPDKGLTSAGTPVPDFTPETMNFDEDPKADPFKDLPKIN
jgi:hypothetical protein